jgi:hypothetical protein
MRTAFAVSAALLIALPAYAQEARDVLEAVAKCAEISDPGDRLKCYDAAALRAKSALAAPPPKQATTPSAVTPETFGLPRPTPPVTKAEDFGKPAPPPAPEDIKSISSTVVEFAKTLRGKALFILANGQVWRQLDSDGTDLPYPPPGSTMKVTVETGFLGSYNLSIEGRNGVIKVTRLK